MDKEMTSKAIAGTIELTSIVDEFLAEMYAGDLSVGSRIGFCNIIVGDNEGQIPHFHIISKSTDFVCCVRLYENRYFIHSSKTGTLNSKQCRLLNNWLNEKSKIIYLENLTNWQVLCSFWEAQGNSLTNVPKNPKMPNYTKIYK